MTNNKKEDIFTIKLDPVSPIPNENYSVVVIDGDKERKYFLALQERKTKMIENIKQKVNIMKKNHNIYTIFDIEEILEIFQLINLLPF